MAREFSPSTTVARHAGGLGLGANDAIWASLWVWFDSVAASCSLLTIGRDNTSADKRDVTHNGIGGMLARSVDASVTVSSAITAYATTGAWAHILAEWGSTSSRAVRVNGGTRTTNATTRALTNAPQQVAVGAATQTTITQVVNGRIAYVAIYAGAPTEDDAAALAAGLHPTLVRPADLLECWDLGLGSPDPGRRGNLLTLTGSPAAVEGPRIILPRGRSMIVVPSAGGGPTPAVGSASVGLSLGAGATGAHVASGGAAVGLSLGADATGSRVSSGTAAAALALDASATGAHVTSGTASAGLSLDVAAQGAHVAAGTATLALSLDSAASGARLAAGSAAPGIALDLAAVGDAPSVDEASGSASLGLSLGATATGAHIASGHASTGVALDVSAVGQLRAAGQAVVALALELAATGDAPSVDAAEGSATLGLSLGAAATGAHVAAGHAVPGVALDLAALGARVSAGQVNVALALDVAAVGQSDVPVNIAAVIASGRAARTPGRAGALVPGRTGAQVPRGE